MNVLKGLENPLVKKAYQFAILSLAGKKRYSGEDFSNHCLKVAAVLERFKVFDPTTLSVAILHHSFSDSAATVSDIEKEFGPEIAAMLGTLDKLRVIKLVETSKKEFAENLRQMFLTLARDLRIVLIKLADIYDNLQTLKYLPEQKRVELAKETIEIFAPLTERLGIGEMKGQMQDLAFEYLYPTDYKKTLKLLDTSLSRLDKALLKIKSKLNITLGEEKIDYRLESRTKHIYSLFTKQQRPEINFNINRIYDLIACRIIVKNTEDCYRVLGIVHKLWRPLPDSVRDYIANPKPNGYRSIHTTVLGPGDAPFEIQIRTEGMHEEAEYGVAAHWHYSETKNLGAADEVLEKGTKVAGEKLKWVKNLSQWQKEVTDNEEFLKSVKTDFLGARIYVFTPKGDVIDLPEKATPIDFAYKVHTRLGDLTTGAKLNDRLVSLNTPLKNGDVCEIIISKNPSKKPSRDWLKFVITSTARRSIKRVHSD
ncbi:bifunctional (p)ppGpp synthetase/guanosine-3',5'-bis(diphosphate) 3'-pyrophosphohydrolase [Candidatus Daviesbacteria bacterium]|nr:bifunctional (p)ppGpp synthetase/guanosine-3',5'-bis(diphosphate) 3'-pyrophosphohydrolase [Candidatus Daviesbacteria bacterium]